MVLSRQQTHQQTDRLLLLDRPKLRYRRFLYYYELLIIINHKNGGFMGYSKIMTISLPPKMSQEVQKMAKQEHRTISELIRETFRQYKMSKILEEGRKEGRRLRKGKRLTDDQIEKLVDALRN